MKKLSIFALCFVAIVCGMFVGCGKNQPTPIVMTRYFKDSVVSQNSESGYVSFHLPSFIGNSVDTTTMKKHSSVTFYGEQDWIAGMSISAIYFYVVADTKLVDEQLSFVMYGLGKWDETANKHKVEVPHIGISTDTNKGQLIKIDMKNYIVTEDVSIILNFVQPYVSFKWTVFGVKVYGEFKK